MTFQYGIPIRSDHDEAQYSRKSENQALSMFAEGRWNKIAFLSRGVESSSPSSTTIMDCDGIDQPVREYRHILSTAADIVSMYVVVKKTFFLRLITSG